MTADDIVCAARAQSGLEDIGDPAILEGLGILLRAYEEEAQFTEAGKQRAIGALISTLANRMRVEDWLKQHPELLERPVEKPLFVFGLPRTGTTLTINLLNADPARRSLLRWEAFDSVPPPTREELHAGPRFDKAQAAIDLALKYVPHISAIHHEDADSPTECQFAMTPSFCAQVYEAQACIPSYREWFLHRASYLPAFRYEKRLLQLLQAFDLAQETRDTRYPMLHAFCTPTRKLGGDAADFTRRQAWIDGQHVYRITGNTGTARFLNFTVQGPRPAMQPGTDWPSLHGPFGDIPEANLFKHQLETAPDGSFELWLGGEKRDANWLPMAPGTRKLFVRQGFDSWDETPAQLSIERVGMEAPRPLPTPETMIEAMAWAGDFLAGMMRDWPDHPYRYSGGGVDPTCLNRFPPERSANSADDARRGRLAAHMCWALAPEEALIVEFDAHDGFWMVSLGGAFMNSMDYLCRPVSYTPARTRVDSDGTVRPILCADVPGYHNWLDTQGFAAALPADSVRVMPQERVAQLHTRFDSIRRRYALYAACTARLTVICHRRTRPRLPEILSGRIRPTRPRIRQPRAEQASTA